MRNAKERKRYTPRLAEEKALFKRTCRGRIDRLKTKEIREYVIKHLKKRWSPEQISGRLKLEYPNQKISHEAIYQYIYSEIYEAIQAVEWTLNNRPKKRLGWKTPLEVFNGSVALQG